LHEVNYTRKNIQGGEGDASMSELADRVNALNWWHVIELPDGTITPGCCDYRKEEDRARFQLPDDFKGQSVLDLGTFDGYWAIEAKKRGANVTAADRWLPMLETAELALSLYDIGYFWTDNLDDSDWNITEYFDIVFFFGILYHLKNPYQGLLNAARCLKPGGKLFLESAVNQGKLMGMPKDIPLLWVIDEIHHNDKTNYHMPNEAAIIQLAKMAGLERYGEIVYGESGFRVGMTFQKK
jgi:2-polyprenyl-3-methyl-5-hydroxy-6-metoxy-1,4-benzoquinol methylase